MSIERYLADLRVCSVCRVPSPFVGLCVCRELFCEVCIERHYENPTQEVCRLAWGVWH